MPRACTRRHGQGAEHQLRSASGQRVRAVGDRLAERLSIGGGPVERGQQLLRSVGEVSAKQGTAGHVGGRSLVLVVGESGGGLFPYYPEGSGLLPCAGQQQPGSAAPCDLRVLRRSA